MTDLQAIGPGWSQMDWRDLVNQHGEGLPTTYLAHITGQSAKEIAKLRDGEPEHSTVCADRYVQAFVAWNSWSPKDKDWPSPIRCGSTYEWLPPEDGLLARLVRLIRVPEISEVLSQRLSELTGDPAAKRSLDAVEARMNDLGLAMAETVGGLTVSVAGAILGTKHAVVYAIDAGHLEARRESGRKIIPYAEWVRWRKRRHDPTPPPELIPLGQLQELLGVRARTLGYYARLGLVPGATYCNKPYGNGVVGSGTGRWHIDPESAKRLIDLRQRGQPMPWSGHVPSWVARRVFSIWLQRQHPVECAICRDIWGDGGPPDSIEAFAKRYETLGQGGRRHLVMPWSPALTVQEVARRAKMPEEKILRAIENGTLVPLPGHESTRISKSEVNRWLRTSRRFFDRVQGDCTEEQAATMLGLSVEQLRGVLERMRTRDTTFLTPATLHSVFKIVRKKRGRTIQEAAQDLGQPIKWVRNHVRDGLIKVTTLPWATDEPLITDDMFLRLKKAAVLAAGTASSAIDGVDEATMRVHSRTQQAKERAEAVGTARSTGRLDSSRRSEEDGHQ